MTDKAEVIKTDLYQNTSNESQGLIVLRLPLSRITLAYCENCDMVSFFTSQTAANAKSIILRINPGKRHVP